VLTWPGLDHPDQPRTAPGHAFLASLPDTEPTPGKPVGDAWAGWTTVDPALLVRRRIDGRDWASTSAALVAAGTAGLRYDFTARPGDPGSWYEVTDA
jgi:hypothetical protein